MSPSLWKLSTQNISKKFCKLVFFVFYFDLNTINFSSFRYFNVSIRYFDFDSVSEFYVSSGCGVFKFHVPNERLRQHFSFHGREKSRPYVRVTVVEHVLSAKFKCPRLPPFVSDLFESCFRSEKRAWSFRTCTKHLSREFASHTRTQKHIKIDVIRYCNDKLNQEQLFFQLLGGPDVVKVDTLL